MNKKEIIGIHHVTAIASDPQQNIDFYTGFLGLRLVKLTVNFDDPTSYHLYYGDEVGHPGTIPTFFLWPGAPKGRMGTGQLTATSFSIPEEATEYWVQRLKSHQISFEGPSNRFEEQIISFKDPDGLSLELVSHPYAKECRAWKDGPVPPEFGLRGFHSVTLSEESYEPTVALLTNTMGFHKIREQGSRIRFEVGTGGPSALVDVLRMPDSLRGLVSVGTVHHVAWRTADDEQQKSWREQLADTKLNVTPVIDRKYFHSIYFREPGGVLFEIATDLPGFTVDEQADELGSRLALPDWLEPQRDAIKRLLPSVRLPSISKTA